MITKKKALWMSSGDLVKMNPEELRQYIHLRLMKKKLDPPAPSAQGIEPEHFFLETFKQVKNKKFQARFGEQVNRLLLDDDFTNSEYLSRLLHLVEMLDLFEAVPALFFLLGNKKEALEKLRGYYEPNLVAVTLKQMVRFELDESILCIKWEELLDHPDYAPIAFNAILRSDPNRALDNFAPFIRTAVKYPDQINFASVFKKLADQVTPKQMAKAIRPLIDADTPELHKKIWKEAKERWKTLIEPSLGTNNNWNHLLMEKGKEKNEFSQTTVFLSRGGSCQFLSGRQTKTCGASDDVLNTDDLSSYCTSGSYYKCPVYMKKQGLAQSEKKTEFSEIPFFPSYKH
jgi:hypothetical protein